MAGVGLIATTGVTGGLGGRVAQRLASRGVAQRLVARDPGRAPELAGAEVVTGATTTATGSGGRFRGRRRC
jgi:NAD(P)H dehydrogenase (quinone)